MTIRAGPADKLEFVGNSFPLRDGPNDPVFIANLSTFLQRMGFIVSLPTVSGIFSITVPAPATPSDIVMGRTYAAITITEVTAVIDGAGSITVNVEYGPNRAVAGTDVFTVDKLINNSTVGHTYTAFDNPNIPADSWVRFTVSALVADVDFVTLSFEYEFD